MKKPNNTRARLALYRQRAAASKWCDDWRKHKYGNTWATEWHSGIREDGQILTDNRDTLGEYLGDWCDFNGGSREMRDTNGFYIDDFYSETLRGGVVRLRTARFTLYIPCTYCTGWDGATLYLKDAEKVDRGDTEAEHETAKHTAACAAMYYADKEAEAAREDNAKERAADQIHDARAEIHEINKHTRTLLAEIRAAGTFSPVICEALRDKVRDLLADRRRCFETIAERTDNFWSAVSYS